MISGSPSGVTAGATEDLVESFTRTQWPNGLGETVRLKPADGEGDQYWAFVVDGAVQQIRYISESSRDAGAESEFQAFYDSTRTSHAVGFVPLGDWPTIEDLTPEDEQLAYVSDKGKGILVRWPSAIESLEAYGDSAQFSNWSLTGFVRGKNCAKYDKTTQWFLDLQMTTILTTFHLVYLYCSGQLVAAGTINGDGTVTLAEQNDSGISGTVDLTYSADIASGVAYVVARWAASYKIHCATSLSFPRTEESTLKDDGISENFRLVIPGKTAGTYLVVVQSVSDTGATSTNTSTQDTIVVPGRPLPPGDMTAAMVPVTGLRISFAASATSGATYRLYDSGAGDEVNTPIDFTAIADTHAAGTGTITWTLPTFIGSSGIRRISVAAVYGGIEDGYRKTLELEYGAGNTWIAPRPNDPDFAFSAISGRALTLKWKYNSSDQKVVPTYINLYLIAEGGTLSGTPDTHQAISVPVNSVYSGTIAATAGANGWYTYLVRAEDSVGTLSESVVVGGPVWLTTAAPGGPASAEAEVVE